METSRGVVLLLGLVVFLASVCGCEGEPNTLIAAGSTGGSLQVSPTIPASIVTPVQTAAAIDQLQPQGPTIPPFTVASKEPRRTQLAVPMVTVPSVMESDTTAEPVSTMVPLEIVNVGYSSQGRAISSYKFGSGSLNLVFVAGIHGGYEWNTILLAQKLVAFFKQRPERIPASVAVHVIPNANPDGLYAVTGTEGIFTAGDIAGETTHGRFNGNGIDLNRNWDCQWSPTAVWRGRQISGGEFPFSEPETTALRDHLLSLDPEVVIFWHSAAGGVYSAGCPDPHGPSLELAHVYGDAAGYPVYATFDHYEITGDASDWLTAQGIASFTVELASHENLDWERNMAGIMELLRQSATDSGHLP